MDRILVRGLNKVTLKEVNYKENVNKSVHAITIKEKKLEYAKSLAESAIIK